VIDLGISNPQPEQAVTPWQLPSDYQQMSVGTTSDVKAEAAALLEREREFSRDSATRGAQKAFEAYAANEVRVFRNDKLAFVDKALASSALPASSIVWTWEPAFAEVSHSADLGYSYGTYQLTKADATTKVETGNYYRIWKRQYSVLQGNTWKVVADLLDPLPEPKKS
jgi:hypothetical protein